MKTHLALTLFLASVLAAQGVGGEKTKNEGETWFRAMQKKLAAAKTLKVTFETMAEGRESGTFKGLLQLAEGNKSRLDGSMMLGGKRLEWKLTSDGVKLAEDGPGGEIFKSLTKDRNQRIVGSLSHGGFIALVFFTESDEEGRETLPVYKAVDFRLGKKEKVGDRASQPIDVKLTPDLKGKDKDKDVSLLDTVWIDVETKLPLKRVYLGRMDRNKFRFTETYVNITLDAKIEPKVFRLPK